MGNIQLYTCGNKIHHIHIQRTNKNKNDQKERQLIHYSKSKQRRDFGIIN